MKKHTGCSMQSIVKFPGLCQHFFRPEVNLSKKAQHKIEVIDWYRLESKKYSDDNKPNVNLTCRHFGLGRSTFYYWLSRYKPHDLSSLEDKSRRPKRTRDKNWDEFLIQEIDDIRRKNPTYSKHKIHRILIRDYTDLLIPSESTIGRIIKEYDMFYNPKLKRNNKNKPKSKHREKDRIRLNEKLRATEPNQIIEYDMKHINLPGTKLYALCSIDQMMKQPTIHIASRPSSTQSKIALEKIVQKFGKNITIINDNGSENMAVAEDWLKEMGIKQLWTRPCQPKDKPFIERFIGTFQRECLDLNYRPMTVEEMQKVADDWLKVYENYRPHDSLGGLTPNEFYNKIMENRQNIKENSKMF